VPVVCRGVFFFSSRRRHTRFSRDWSSDVCSSDLLLDFRLHREAMIAVVDNGICNLRSVTKALEAVGAAPQVIRNPAELAAANARSEERRVGKERRSQGRPRREQKMAWSGEMWTLH